LKVFSLDLFYNIKLSCDHTAKKMAGMPASTFCYINRADNPAVIPLGKSKEWLCLAHLFEKSKQANLAFY